MAKTLISRLDAENIVRAAVDPDTHEATGDVYDSVNDVSYPFGGGGGLNVPHLTVHFKITEEATAPTTYLTPTIVYDNNIAYIGLPEIADTIPIMNAPVLSGNSVDIIMLYPNPNAFDLLACDVETEDFIQSKNLINCSIDEYGTVTVTDNSLDSELTIEYTGQK